ncbi:UrcA family protein (plasmid) [Sphingomonas daechungensis]|uniref:UrcA family protein n=1 Tax=Sphingomonas daechungensis TaxID=1176646 RepID=A0ABX6T6N3_9SPHN|nr:UrcA family protein [Sphingomonas daechungensis]
MPAQAASTGKVPSIRIQVAPADLATDLAVESLHLKLKRSARQVCKAELRNDAIQLYWHACYSGALDDAVAQLKELRTLHPATFPSSSILVLAR